MRARLPALVRTMLACATVILAAAGASTAARADTIYNFTVNGTLGDGSTYPDLSNIQTEGATLITGSFSYDETDRTLTALNITTAAGPADAYSENPVIPGATYSLAQASSDVLDSDGVFELISDNGDWTLVLVLQDDPITGALTDLNFPISPDTVAEISQDGLSYRDGLTGSIVDPPVPAPEPTSILLMGAGLAALGVTRRRHSARRPHPA